MPTNRDLAHTPLLDGPQKVFVYGTLKRGFGNHHGHLGDARMLGIGATNGIMFHLGGFPAICTHEPMFTLSGEVYETGWDAIAGMDALEGVGNGHYDRVQIKMNPYGVVWTYVFSEKATRQRHERNPLWVIPSGCWQGPETPSVKWLGFGKGVQVGKFEAAGDGERIKIGRGDNPKYHILREKEDWILVHTETGESVGKYKYLTDILGKGEKPTIRLKPNIRVVDSTQATTATVHPTVRDIMEGRARAYSPTPNTTPMIWTPQGQKEVVPEEPEIPQAARLLGIKVREA